MLSASGLCWCSPLSRWFSLGACVSQHLSWRTAPHVCRLQKPSLCWGCCWSSRGRGHLSLSWDKRSRGKGIMVDSDILIVIFVCLFPGGDNECPGPVKLPSMNIGEEESPGGKTRQWDEVKGCFSGVPTSVSRTQRECVHL